MKIAVGLLALCLASLAVGCQNPGGKILGDTMSYDKDKKTWSPLVDYRAPDIDELTGIDSDPDPADEPEAERYEQVITREIIMPIEETYPAAEPEPTPAPEPAAVVTPAPAPAATPATPASPAKPPAKTPTTPAKK